MSSRPPSAESERKAWTKLLEETYRQFVEQGGPGPQDAASRTGKAGPGPHLHRPHGRRRSAWSTSSARSRTPIAEAKKAAGLKADEKVELLVLPQPRSFFEQLFGDESVTGDLDAVAPGLLGQTLRQVAAFQRLLAEPSLMLMPMRIELK